MQADEPCKIGNLYSSSQTFLKKSWVKRFYALYKASNHGIQRVEVFDAENNFIKQSPPLKIITLTDCIKVTAAPQKQQSNVFEVRTKTHSYLFSAETFQEMTEWLACLQSVAFGANLGTTATVNGTNSHSLDKLGVEARVCHEENMLYSSVDGPEIYLVKIRESEAAIRCNLQGMYNLVLTQVGISLTDCSNTGKPIFVWSYRHIRRYGFDREVFFFEAGRKSSSGEGRFMLETKDGKTVFQSVASLANQLKSSKSEGNLTSSPTCEDKAFFTTSQPCFPDTHTPRDVKRSDPDAKSADEDSDYATVKPRIQIAKPPRRSKPKVESTYGNVPPRTNVYEDSDETAKHLKQKDPTEPLYDEPHELQDAWRTHGRDVEDNYIQPAESQPEATPLYEDVANKAEVDALGNSFERALKRTGLEEDGTGYDRLQFQQPQQGKANAEHIYGKLNCKGTDENQGDGQNRSSPTPDYANIIISTDKTSKTKVTIESESPTPHFTTNDAIYAQIIKKNKK